MRKIRSAFSLPLYPCLIAAYPVLALLSHNISQVRYTAGIRPLVVSVIVATVFFLLLRLIYRDWHRAAFATAMLTVLFYIYGHVYNLISGKWDISSLNIWMLGAWFFLSAVVMFLAGRGRNWPRSTALVLNIVSLGLVLYLIVTVAWQSFPPKTSNDPVDDYAPIQALNVVEGQTLPDIYYIIVDSYGRSDLLAQSFQFDNSAFIQHLEDSGFFVAKCSQSNYNRTDVSLASSLNMDYLQNLDDDYHPGNIGRSTLWASIKNSTVRYELESAGYKSVAFATGFAFTEVTAADVYLSPSPVWSSMTGFETLLVRATPFRHFEDLGWINLDEIDGQRYRERTQFVFDSISMLARMSGPKFAFVHIITPHPPFVYGPDGTFTDPAPFLNEDGLYTYDSYIEGYRNQVEYVTGKVEDAVDTILAESATPPVIIVQGDHAPWLQTGYRKFQILNAYYFPGYSDVLYSTISPVNTFRLVLNTYLGADYPLLDDTSYYSPVPNIYEFEQNQNPCLSQ